MHKFSNSFIHTQCRDEVELHPREHALPKKDHLRSISAFVCNKKTKEDLQIHSFRTLEYRIACLRQKFFPNFLSVLLKKRAKKL
jgi:hypothetical protein